jgi:hypothetical protein
MSAELAEQTALQASVPELGEPPADEAGFLRLLRSAIWRALMFAWKLLAGTALCQFPVTSILVVGWTYRVMHRAAVKRWWKRSPLRAEGTSFHEFLQADASTAAHARWPNWMLRPRAAMEAAPSGRGRIRRTTSRLFGSLWLNAKVGVQGIFNTWVLTMPACVLWLFAWYDGWNNSFNKGYEQAAVGPLTGLLGVALFIAAMLYVPMAQARQAATGSWRAFFHFRLLGRIIRERPLGCLGLAVLYSVLSLPVTALKTAPEFFPQMNRALEDAGDAAIRDLLVTYFFWASAGLLVCYVTLRLAAARLYASALLSTLRSGRIAAGQLEPHERACLVRLHVLPAPPPSECGVLLRSATWTARKTTLTLIAVLVVVIWFSFVAQIFISEFLNYHPVTGWLNQPLVQLPWLRYIPGRLAP